MQSVSQSHFARVSAPRISRSSFDRSSPYKNTMDSGLLVPIFFDECLPGDSFKLNASFFVRLNTPIVPILDNAYLETFFFEVPYRQVWDNWGKFCGEQDNPGDSTDFLIPQMVSPAGGYLVGSMMDSLGIPTLVPGLTHSALPFRAINHIYNTWFRDQNLQNSVLMPTNDGPDDPSNYTNLSRGKRADYFTSALPWPQKSDSGSVTIPIAGQAPITTDAANASSLGIYSTTQGGTLPFAMDASVPSLALGGNPEAASQAMYADLTQATATTINQLRQSIAVQRLFEKDARGGTRLIEITENHFGVKSPDLRLQRPGYLGGGRTQLNISPIAQTQASSTGVTPQGNLSAIGTFQASGHGFTKSFTEHTIVIGFACIRADITYQRGLARKWSRNTRFDHYWPELATLGEQSILRKEIWADGTAADEDVWGYQERSAEYRYAPGQICGKFRSTDAQSLDYWHLSQDFETAPVLGASFIEEKPPFDRVIATPDEPQFKMDAFFNLKCARPMPMYGIPGLDKL